MVSVFDCAYILYLMKKTVITLFIISLFSCNSNTGSCTDLPSSFSTYEEAVEAVENSNFKIEEEADTSKSSWIRSADFYSCDGESGYLIISTDDHEYIHENLPVSVWEDFKNADSFGKFYNANIKNNYQMISKK